LLAGVYASRTSVVVRAEHPATGGDGHGFRSALIVVDRDASKDEIRPLFARIGIKCVISDGPTRDQAAYVERNDAATIVVTSHDPLSRLTDVQMAGVRGPVVVLYAGTSEKEISKAIEAGAAAVERWPLGADSLSRVLEEVGRNRARPPSHPSIELDPVGRIVRFHGEAVRLTPHEFAILHLLTKRAGKVVGTHELGTYAWGDSLPSRSGDQIVTVYISRLRRKLRTIDLADRLRTVPTAGYVLDVT
jgi:DNA-binding response OmpR family regulator